MFWANSYCLYTVMALFDRRVSRIYVPCIHTYICTHMQVFRVNWYRLKYRTVAVAYISVTHSISLSTLTTERI